MELRAWCLSKHRKTMGKPSNAERSLIFFDMRRVSVWYTQTHLAQKWSNSAMGLDESQDAFGWVLLTSHLVYIPPALLGYRPHEIIRSWSHVPIIWLATNSIINNNNNNNPWNNDNVWQKKLSLRSSSRCLFKNQLSLYSNQECPSLRNKTKRGG